MILPLQVALAGQGVFASTCYVAIYHGSAPFFSTKNGFGSEKRPITGPIGTGYRVVGREGAGRHTRLRDRFLEAAEAGEDLEPIQCWIQVDDGASQVFPIRVQDLAADHQVVHSVVATILLPKRKVICRIHVLGVVVLLESCATNAMRTAVESNLVSVERGGVNAAASRKIDQSNEEQGEEQAFHGSPLSKGSQWQSLEFSIVFSYARYSLTKMESLLYIR